MAQLRGHGWLACTAYEGGHQAIFADFHVVQVTPWVNSRWLLFLKLAFPDRVSVPPLALQSRLERLQCHLTTDEKSTQACSLPGG